MDTYYLYSLGKEIGYAFRGGGKWGKGKEGIWKLGRRTIRKTRIAAGIKSNYYRTFLRVMYNIKSNRIVQSHYVIFITEVDLS